MTWPAVMVLSVLALGLAAGTESRRLPEHGRIFVADVGSRQQHRRPRRSEGFLLEDAREWLPRSRTTVEEAKAHRKMLLVGRAEVVKRQQLEHQEALAKTVSEARSRKLKKLALPILLALKMKLAVLLPVILGGVALVAFKGLWAGFTALGIATVLGLRAVVLSAAPSVSYIPQPYRYHAPSPEYYHEHWDRDSPHRYR